MRYRKWVRLLIVVFHSKSSEPRPSKGDKRGRGSELSGDLSGGDRESIEPYVFRCPPQLKMWVDLLFQAIGFEVNGRAHSCVCRGGVLSGQRGPQSNARVAAEILTGPPLGPPVTAGSQRKSRRSKADGEFSIPECCRNLNLSCGIA